MHDTHDHQHHEPKAPFWATMLILGVSNVVTLGALALLVDWIMG